MSAVQRLLDEMTRRNYAAKTTREYSASVRRLGTHFGCCPSKLSLEQIRGYQLHLIQEKHVSWSYYNNTMAAIRFLYLKVLQYDWPIEQLPYGKRGRQLPVVLSRQEVFQLWRPLRQLKRRILLMTAYSAALQISELVHLRVEDLDGERMLIRIPQRGCRQERFVPYSPTLKQRLGPYLADHRSPWLFSGSSSERPLPTWAASNICRHAAQISQFEKPVTLYTLRHSAAVHFVEMGVNPRTLQKVLGHDRLSSTMRYIQVTYQPQTALVDPLDLLTKEAPDDDISPQADA